MAKLLEQPDAIIVTLPARFFTEYSHEKYLEEIKRMQDPDDPIVWYRVCKNLPIHDVAYVYTIIDNKIHHRAQFCGLIRNQTLHFPRPAGGRRTFENANAIMTTGPIVFPPHEIPMRGFQGFRYTKMLF